MRSRFSRATATRRSTSSWPVLGDAEVRDAEARRPGVRARYRACDRDRGDRARRGRAISRASRLRSRAGSATISRTRRKRSAASTRGVAAADPARRTASRNPFGRRDARGSRRGRRSRRSQHRVSCRGSRSSSTARRESMRSRRTPTASTATATTREASSCRECSGSARRRRALDALLAQHDSYSYFDACGLLLRTGPTRTNVNDFRLILCQAMNRPDLSLTANGGRQRRASAHQDSRDARPGHGRPRGARESAARRRRRLAASISRTARRRIRPGASQWFEPRRKSAGTSASWETCKARRSASSRSGKAR